MKKRRVLVTGNAGSGKSTFSRKLAKRTRLPRHGLDAIVWQSGWKKASEKAKNRKIRALVKQGSWIVDGVSKQAFTYADEIYFLDIPLHRCLLNIALRFAKNGPGTRTDLPAGCPEYIGVFRAVRAALRYQKHTRPWIVKLIEEHPEKKVHWIRNYRELGKV